MTHLRSNATSRSLTVVLSENDWQALRAVEPDAVGWLQQAIRERIGSPAPEQTPGTSQRVTTDPAPWSEDVYS
jgi:hypothetical protein